MIKYVVKVDDRGTKYWTLNGDFHREDGPVLSTVTVLNTGI